MKKSIKKLVSIMVIVILLGSLVGCGKTEAKKSNVPTSTTPQTETQKSEKVVIEFWHYWDGNNGKAAEELVKKFNSENNDIEVKPIFIPGSELMTKLQAAISSGTTPAVAAADISCMANLKASGKLLELDNYLKENNVSVENFYPSLLEYGKLNGKLYSLPVSTNNLALFYNKEIFTKAGLDPNTPPKTWKELESFCEKITKKLPGTYGFEFYTQVGDSGEGLTWQLQPYLWQAGADFIKDGKAAFNNSEGEKALNFLTGLINKKLAPVGSWDDFAKGKCAMVVDGSWMVGIWKDSVNFDFGTAMIPVPEIGKNATNMGGEQIFAFSKNDDENKAAVKFITYMVDTKTQIEWDKKTTFMPISNTVAQDKDYLDWIKNTEPRLQPFVEQQKFAHARPSLEAYPAASLAFAKEIEKAYYGKVTVKQALANAEKAVNAELGK